jgi:hypothetical protein
MILKAKVAYGDDADSLSKPACVQKNTFFNAR